MPRPFRGRRPLAKVLEDIEGGIRANRIRSGPNVLVTSTSGGQFVEFTGGTDESFVWIALGTAGTGADAGLYDWHKLEPLNDGTFLTTTTGGTVASHPAREVNGYADLLDDGSVITPAWMDGFGSPRFQLEDCDFTG